MMASPPVAPSLPSAPFPRVHQERPPALASPCGHSSSTSSRQLARLEGPIALSTILRRLGNLALVPRRWYGEPIWVFEAWKPCR